MSDGWEATCGAWSTEEERPQTQLLGRLEGCQLYCSAGTRHLGTLLYGVQTHFPKWAGQTTRRKHLSHSQVPLPTAGALVTWPIAALQWQPVVAA